MKSFATFSVLAVALVASVGASDHLCYPSAHKTCSAWPGECSTGTQQSPINIANENGTALYQIEFSDEYKEALNKPFIVNNGHTVQVSLNKETTSDLTVTVRINGTSTTYVFAQLHGHWGSEHRIDNEDTTYVFAQLHGHWGSEHRIDNEEKHFEFHLVHYQKDLGSVSNALAKNDPNGLLVLGVFFEASSTSKDNKAFEALTKNVEQVKNADPTTYKSCSGSLNMYDFLPLSGVNSFVGQNVYDIAVYNGSLTTPGCNQIVRWFVFKKPIAISERQKEAFDVLKDSKGEELKGNNRALQSLNGRNVIHAVVSEKTVGDAEVVYATASAFVSRIVSFFRSL
ncbi:unnamed protein product [Allacma fusca]|uniref:Alpha-carbonic anhydrase domain-containing protein n=1 Tax=Allacma fusca TaxID=39272 RepID=A0A8J2LT45_9HEXA|nr:unnamed protein product [Allacma fusca]